MLRYGLLALALSAAIATSAHAQMAERVVTRHGTLSWSPDTNVLLLNGRPVTPRVEGNNGLSLLRKFTVSDADVVIVQDNGGTGCPAQYYAVIVAPQGAKPTKAFGTCSDLIMMAQEGDSITVSMPGFKAHTNMAEMQRAARERHVFRIVGGVVTENGKPVR